MANFLEAIVSIDAIDAIDAIVAKGESRYFNFKKELLQKDVVNLQGIE